MRHTRRLAVRASSIHGKGVFALREIKAGERIIEYKGKRTTWSQAMRRFERIGEAGHTFFFGLADGRVIDGGQGGNSARWLNHACEANCEAVEDNDRVFIQAARDIRVGEELFLVYGLSVDQPLTEDVREQYRCCCGHSLCRGTMLAEAA